MGPRKVQGPHLMYIRPKMTQNKKDIAGWVTRQNALSPQLYFCEWMLVNLVCKKQAGIFCKKLNFNISECIATFHSKISRE